MDLFWGVADNKETGKDDGIVGPTCPTEVVANEAGHIIHKVRAMYVNHQ